MWGYALLGTLVGLIIGFLSGRFWRVYGIVPTVDRPAQAGNAQVFNGKICVRGTAISGSGVVPVKVIAKVYATSSGIPANPLGEAGTVETTTIDPSTGAFEIAEVDSGTGSQVLAVWTLEAAKLPVDFTGVTHPSGTDCKTVSFPSAGDRTWQCPAGWTNVNIECWGGGGGGDHNSMNPTGGGGGGAYSKINFAPTVGTTYEIRVGSGGPTSTDGEESYFTANIKGNPVCSAKGGSRGTSTAGGAGGVTTGFGSTKLAGGQGGNPGAPGGSGGGGGSSAGTASNGAAGANGSAGGAGGSGVTNAGNGGNGSSGGTPGNGAAPGGGGGGIDGTTGMSGGSGGAGLVIITRL